MFQDRSCGNPIAGVLPDVTPRDVSIWLDDEHSRRGEAVTQEVVHAEGFGDLVRRVGQHGVTDPRALAPVFHDLDRRHHYREYFCAGILKRLIGTLQLAELRVGLSAPDALEKDQHHRPLSQLLR